MATDRLLVEISGHGLGHLSQTAPVINALRLRVSGIRLMVRSQIPEHALRRRIEGEFEYFTSATDPGLVMNSAVHVDVDASYRAYQRFHNGWNEVVDEASRNLSRLAPDLVVTNVSYLALAAASRIGVPCAAMSSINWAEVFSHYCGHLPGADALRAQIQASYASANAFLALTPGMPMDVMPRLRRIGPVAATGRSSAASIRRELGVSVDRSLVLIALGGIPSEVPMDHWPDIDDMAVISDLSKTVPRTGYFDADELALPFVDLLASCDAVITKPGYGTFTEAACHGVRVLYTRRPDWPEARFLCEWIQKNATSAAIDWSDLMAGRFVDPLRRLLALPAHRRPRPIGIDQAASALASMLTP